MRSSRRNFVILFTVLALAVPMAISQVFDRSKPIEFSGVTREEIENLLKDIAATNPKVIKALAADPALRKGQIENIKQLFAFASQAQKDGIADDQINHQELENIRSEVIAVNYDKEINKNKGPMPPFGYISQAQVMAFWNITGTAKAREEDFQNFLDSKTALQKAGNPQKKDHEISNEERVQAREFFAKVKIYESEYETKKASLPKEFRDKVNLQIKLQQAQFLARLYSEKVAEKLVVTDEEIDEYISEHPDLDTSQRREKAEKILIRAKAGEDFAKLANEFSEDPGNKGANGKLLGGLYKNVPVGRMVPLFEQAALALQPGEVSPEIVETDFGYHVIKLEKRGRNPADPKSEMYDVRHILISTTYTDTTDAASDPKSIKQYVRSKLETEKENRLLNEVVAANNIQVPDDFTVPTITPTAGKAKPSPRRRPAKKRR